MTPVGGHGVEDGVKNRVEKKVGKNSRVVRIMRLGIACRGVKCIAVKRAVNTTTTNNNNEDNNNEKNIVNIFIDNNNENNNNCNEKQKNKSNL